MQAGVITFLSLIPMTASRHEGDVMLVNNRPLTYYNITAMQVHNLRVKPLCHNNDEFDAAQKGGAPAVLTLSFHVCKSN